MKTDALDYQKLYYLASKEFNAKTTAYNIDRKAENLAYLIGLETGLRVGDLLKLKYHDFYFNSKINRYCFDCVVTKTKSEHTGVISNELYNYIEKFRSIVKTHYNKLNDSIFFNFKSKPSKSNPECLYTRMWLHKRIKIVGKKLNFENCGVHSIRKASAINVYNDTKNIGLAQYHLTHKRASTTDKYLSVSKSTALEQLALIY